MNNENELYNLPLASFTFGKEENKIPILKSNINSFISKNQSKPNNNKNFFTSIKKKNLKVDTMGDNQGELNNNFFENNSSQNNISVKEEVCELTFGRNNELIKEANDSNFNKNKNNVNKHYDNYISSFVNNNGINDSFVHVILYSIYHMKLFRKYIINDLNFEQIQNIQNKNDNSDFHHSILYYLREILLQMGKKIFIDIYKFREILSRQFQNHRKFLADQPDDPADLLFILINAIHSYSIQFSQNDISDETCTEKCFSHKFIWLDLARIDECKCKGTTKRLFSNHNYITDIPMKKIFNLMKNNHINDSNNEKFVLYESNQKLFNYYTNLISGIQTDCPVNGQRCPINKTFHKLHLSNSPCYLIFNLEHEMNQIEDSYSYSVMNILKTFVLIPNKFDIWILFELNNKKNKNDFDFLGCILFKISKVYSCAFKNKKGLILYYECNNQIIDNENNKSFIEFVSYFDFVVFCIKNGLIPIILIYQGSFLSNKSKDNANSMSNSDEFLTNEQIISLEKFCINTDNLYSILKNKIRGKENLISQKNSKRNNNSYLINNNILNPNKIISDEYICANCKNKNKIINKICVECGYNNNIYLLNNISNTTKKIDINKKYINSIPKNINDIRGKNVLNYSLTNKNLIKDNEHMIIQLSKRKKICTSPDINHKDNKKLLENYNFETYQNKNNFDYMDLPLPYMPKKEKKISLNINEKKNQNYNLNKTEIDINNKSNFSFPNDMKINKKMRNSPKIHKNNNLSNSNINNNHKKILSVNNKNKIPLNKLNDINRNIEKNNTNKKYEKNIGSNKINTIARTLTSNKEMDKINKSYFDSVNQINFRNKIENNIPNLRKENSQVKKNNSYNVYEKDIIETEINEFNKKKRKNFDLNNLYINGNSKNNKNYQKNNLNYMNYSYNDIHFNIKRNSKQNNKESLGKIFNNRTYNKRKNDPDKKSKIWTCNNCSNINNDDYLYCKVCKRNKEEEIKRVKTPINNKKIKLKIKHNNSNGSFNNNLKTFENSRSLRKDGFNGFNSTKGFRKNQLYKNNNISKNNEKNLNDNSTKTIYINPRGEYIYRTYNKE